MNVSGFLIAKESIDGFENLDNHDRAQIALLIESVLTAAEHFIAGRVEEGFTQQRLSTMWREGLSDEARRATVFMRALKPFDIAS